MLSRCCGSRARASPCPLWTGSCGARKIVVTDRRKAMRSYGRSVMKGYSDIEGYMETWGEESPGGEAIMRWGEDPPLSTITLQQVIAGELTAHGHDDRELAEKTTRRVLHWICKKPGAAGLP